MKRSSNELSGAYWALRRTPPDPVWASASMLERVRRALREVDPQLALWWAPTRGAAYGDMEKPGRWRVVRYGQRRGGWTTWFYWEGPKGEYRHPDPPEPILQKLKRDQVNVRVLRRQIDAQNDRNAERSREVRSDELRRKIEDERAFMRAMVSKYGTGGYTRALKREMRKKSLKGAVKL